MPLAVVTFTFAFGGGGEGHWGGSCRWFGGAGGNVADVKSEMDTCFNGVKGIIKEGA